MSYGLNTLGENWLSTTVNSCLEVSSSSPPSLAPRCPDPPPRSPPPPDYLPAGAGRPPGCSAAGPRGPPAGGRRSRRPRPWRAEPAGSPGRPGSLGEGLCEIRLLSRVRLKTALGFMGGVKRKKHRSHLIMCTVKCLSTSSHPTP